MKRVEILRFLWICTNVQPDEQVYDEQQNSVHEAYQDYFITSVFSNATYSFAVVNLSSTNISSENTLFLNPKAKHVFNLIELANI